MAGKGERQRCEITCAGSNALRCSGDILHAEQLRPGRTTGDTWKVGDLGRSEALHTRPAAALSPPSISPRQLQSVDEKIFVRKRRCRRPRDHMPALAGSLCRTARLQMKHP